RRGGSAIWESKTLRRPWLSCRTIVRTKLAVSSTQQSGLIFIAVWKLLVPFPRALDDRVERLEFRLPAKLFFDFFRRSDEHVWVAWSPWFSDRLDFSPGDFAAGLAPFSTAATAASTEIVASAARCAESQNVRLGKIKDVNVVANTCSVGGVVVGSINFDVRPPTERCLQHSRNEMRLRPVVFAKFLRCTGGVEIAQANKLQPVNLIVPAQNFLKREFGLAVWVDRARRRGFVNGHAIGRTKNRAG